MKKLSTALVIGLLVGGFNVQAQNKKPENGGNVRSATSVEKADTNTSGSAVKKSSTANRASATKVETKATRTGEVRRKENGRKGISPGSPD